MVDTEIFIDRPINLYLDIGHILISDICEVDTPRLKSLLHDSGINVSDDEIGRYSHLIIHDLYTTIGAFGIDINWSDHDFQLTLNLIISNRYMDKDYSPIVTKLLELMKSHPDEYATLLAPVHPNNIATIRTLYKAGLTPQKETLPNGYRQFTFELNPPLF